MMGKDIKPIELVSDNSTQFEIQGGQNLSSRPMYGNHKVYMFRDGQPRITIGPHWYLSIVTVGMITGFGYLMFVSTTKLRSMAEWKKIGLLFLIFLDLFLFLVTALKNEGIVNQYNQPPIELGEQMCEICHIRREQNTYHCTDCNSCIQNLDHHCIWTGKCIGKGNVRWFYSFLFITFFFFIYVALITLL